jgi:adenylate cyclase
MKGAMIPLSGGDTIPLLKDRLLVGRRESCDIRLRFANVSAHHCELTLQGGYWYIRDLQSRNGIKVNNVRVQEKRIDPGDTVSIAKHQFTVRYSPHELGAVGPPPDDTTVEDVLSKSLMERTGLEKKLRHVSDPTASKRVNVNDDSKQQLGHRKDPNKPLS